MDGIGPQLGGRPGRCAWEAPGRAWGTPGVLPQREPPIAGGPLLPRTVNAGRGNNEKVFPPKAGLTADGPCRGRRRLSIGAAGVTPPRMDSGAGRWEIALRYGLGQLNLQEKFSGAWYASGGAGGSCSARPPKAGLTSDGPCRCRRQLSIGVPGVTPIRMGSAGAAGRGQGSVHALRPPSTPWRGR